MQKLYRSPQILDLGSAAALTEGSYPHTPDTLSNVHSGKKATKKAAKKGKKAKKTAKKRSKKK